MPLGILTIIAILETDEPVFQSAEYTTDVSVQTNIEDQDVKNKYKLLETTVTTDVSEQTNIEDQDVDEKYKLFKKTVTTDVSSQTDDVDCRTQNVNDDCKLPEKTGFEKVLLDIEKVWRSGDNSDVIVQVKEVEFKAHKVILAARMPVLTAMFQHDTAESRSGVVTIKDCEPAIFEEFLNYIYTGSPGKLTAQNAIALYVVAEKYLADDLKSQCLQYIRATLNMDTFCDVVMLAVRHGESDLLEHAIRFATENIRHIIKSVEWQNFIQEEPIVANEILIKAFG